MWKPEVQDTNIQVFEVEEIDPETCTVTKRTLFQTEEDAIDYCHMVMTGSAAAVRRITRTLSGIEYVKVVEDIEEDEFCIELDED